MATDAVVLSIFSASDIEQHRAELGELIHACVHAGASIGYILPFSAQDGEKFWMNNVLPAVGAGGRVLVVATRNGRIEGAVQLDRDTPPNQPHRGEVRKLMVHPAFRRRGLARMLMVEVEQIAARDGRSLLTLDTRTGDDAEPLYTSLGYKTVGVIPFYCLDPHENRLDSTTIMFKSL